MPKLQQAFFVVHNYKMTLLSTLVYFVTLLSPKDTATTINVDRTISPIDTTKSIKIGKYWTTPKLIFEFNEFLELKNDTIVFGVCSNFVHLPFGSLTKKEDIKKSSLKSFSVKGKLLNFYRKKELFYTLAYKKSKLLLWFDKYPGAIISYIQKGEIFDEEINLGYGVKIGMKKEDFIKTFFENYSPEIFDNKSCIVFASCASDIEHIYEFENNKLVSVRYKKDWKVPEY